MQYGLWSPRNPWIVRHNKSSSWHHPYSSHFPISEHDPSHYEYATTAESSLIHVTRIRMPWVGISRIRTLRHAYAPGFSGRPGFFQSNCFWNPNLRSQILENLEAIKNQNLKKNLNAKLYTPLNPQELGRLRSDTYDECLKSAHMHIAGNTTILHALHRTCL